MPALLRDISVDRVCELISELTLKGGVGEDAHILGRGDEAKFQQDRGRFIQRQHEQVGFILIAHLPRFGII